jgi:hypothetical protein
MQEEQIREALNRHWRASAAGDANAEHDIYDENAVCDYPQSGERILGRSNLQALRSHHPGTPSGFNVKRILGKGDLWITEYTITYQGRPAFTVSIMEFRDGKVVQRHSISRIPSRRRPGGADGFSASSDAHRDSIFKAEFSPASRQLGGLRVTVTLTRRAAGRDKAFRAFRHWTTPGGRRLKY